MINDRYTQKKSRNSIEKEMSDNNIEQRERRYTDIEDDMEFNSESSSTDDDDSDDSIGGGRHVRRSSKPWMQIKQKIENQRKKEKEKNDEIKDQLDNSDNKTPVAMPRAVLSRIPSVATPTTDTASNSNSNPSPPPPQPQSSKSQKKKGIDHLTPDLIPTHLQQQSPYLQTVISQQEEDTMTTPDFDQLKEDKKHYTLQTLAVTVSNASGYSANTANTVEIVSSPELAGSALIPTTSVITIDSADLQSSANSGNSTPTGKHPNSMAIPNSHSMMERIRFTDVDTQFTSLTMDDSILITPGSDFNAQFDHHHLPSMSKQPQLQHKHGQSHVGDSILDGDDTNLKLEVTQLRFRDSNLSQTSLISRDDRINDSNFNLLKEENLQYSKQIDQLQDQCKELQDKYNKLEKENKDMIDSKMKLLTNTASEITKLKRVINVVLNICVNNQNNNLKQVITTMLKSA